MTPRAMSQFVVSLLDSKPSLAVYGDGTDTLSYDSLLRRYGPAMSSSSATSSGEQWGGGGRMMQALGLKR